MVKSRIASYVGVRIGAPAAQVMEEPFNSDKETSVMDQQLNSDKKAKEDKNEFSYKLYLEDEKGPLREGHEQEDISEKTLEIYEKLWESGQSQRLTPNEAKFVRSTILPKIVTPELDEHLEAALTEGITHTHLPDEFMKILRNSILHHKEHASIDKKGKWERMQQLTQSEIDNNKDKHDKNWKKWVKEHMRKGINGLKGFFDKVENTAKKDATLLKNEAEKGVKKAEEVGKEVFQALEQKAEKAKENIKGEAEKFGQREGRKLAEDALFV